jgi:CHAD domain-containing protein
MLWNEPGTRLGLDAEYLHDMRVASRRLREALRVFRDALPARRVQALRRHLRWIGNGLGRVRDLDVHLTDLEEEARNVPFSLRSGLLLYRDLLRARRSKAREALLRMLATRRYAGFVESFGSFLRKGAPKRPSAPAAAEPVTTAARAAIRRRLKRVLKDGRAVGPDTPDEELHRLRIRCKRLRYTCEFFAGLYGAPAEDMARRAKSVQDVLGRHQDSVVAADTLAAAAQDVRAPRREGRDMLMAMGYLTAWHGERARQARRGFRKRWRKLDRKKVRKRLRSKMDRLAAKPT